MCKCTKIFVPFLLMNTEVAEELIRLLGEKKIRRMYELLGSTPLPVATLIKWIKTKSILKQLNSEKFISVTAFAKQYGLTKRTVYRILKKFRKKL